MNSRPVRLLRAASLVLAMAGVAWPAGRLSAQSPRLVVDLSPGTTQLNPYPRFLTTVGGKLLFVAGTRAEGSELWVSDGTPDGARLVRDLVPGPLPPTYDPYSTPCDFGPVDLLRLDDRILFVDWGPGRSLGSLFATDGSSENTVALLAGRNGISAGAIRKALGGAWVLAGDGYGSHHLLLTDGTVEGTRIVAPVEGYPNDAITIEDGSVLLMLVMPDSGKPELWRSDGTAQGTRRYAGLPGGRSYPWFRHSSGAVAIFSLDDGEHGTEPWRTDGTEEGTALLADLVPGPGSSQLGKFQLLGSRTLFTANWGSALWAWNGTSPPVHLAATASSALVAGPTAAWFVGTDPEHGAEIWKTDGTPEGTSLAHDLNPGPPGSSPSPVAELGGGVYAFGTAPGTATGLYRLPAAGPAELLLVAGAPGFSCFPDARLSAVLPDDSLAFVYRIGGRDRLARTDGTPEGTNDLFVGSVGASSFSEHWSRGGPGPPNLDGRLFLTWRSPAPPYYPILATDGTAEGSGAVAGPSGEQLYLSPSASIGSTLYLAGNGEVHRLDRGRNVTERLWGFTGGEIYRVTGLAAARDRLVVATDSWPNQRRQVWGWGAGMTGPVELGRCLGGVVPWQGRALFVSRVSDSGFGGDLTVTDGTPEGTRPLGPRNVVSELIPDGRQLFYWRSVSNDLELWRTDGSPGGDVRIFSRTYESPESSAPDITAWGRSALLRRGVDFYYTELVRLGPAAGEEIVLGRARSGEFSQDVGFDELTPVGSRVFFRHASRELGSELWSTDGTPEGTGPVADISPGPDGSRPRDLMAVDGILLFAASDGVHGVEPWRSNGTAAGTWRLGDVAPGTRSSNPATFVRVCSQILFLAESPATGRELWALDPLVAGLQQSLPCRTAPDAPSEREPTPATPGR